MTKHLAAGTPYMFSDVGISTISPLAQSFRMKTSGKCAHTRREEVRSVRGDDSQVSVPAQKKLLTRGTVSRSRYEDDAGDTKIRVGPPVQKSTGESRSRGVKRQHEDEELDEVEEDEDVQSHGSEGQFDDLDEEEVLPKKVRRAKKHALPSFDGGSSPPEHPHSPPRLAAGQNQKHRAAQDQLPTTGITQVQRTSSQFRERPHVDPQAHRTKRQPGTALPSTDRHRSKPSTARQKRKAVNSEWTHIAKVFGMEYSPWITEPELDRALRYKMGQDLPEDTCAGDLARLLDGYGFGDDVRKDKKFRANFLLGLRELRSEMVSSLSRAAMEILGPVDTPQRDFRDQTFDKSEHPRFVDLLDNNKFLGTGENYLCSDQIVKALRVFLCGPGSIESLKNPSRSRINRYRFTTIPPALIPFTATVIYFILRGSGSFECDPEGDEEYQGFFKDRCEEMNALGPERLTLLYNRLDEEVFGIKRKEATAEQRRQREFSKRRLEEIRAQAAREEAEEKDTGGQQTVGDEQGGSGSKD